MLEFMLVGGDSRAKARFTNGFCLQFKFDEHATTAQLSCHVQNFVAITVLESM